MLNSIHLLCSFFKMAENPWVLSSRAGISSFSLLDKFITSVSLSSEKQAGALTILDNYFTASLLDFHSLEEVFDHI